MDFFQNTYFSFKENNNMAVEKSQSNDKFLEKKRLPVFTWIKKHSSKQVTSITCTLEKKLFASATFKDL